MGVVMLSCLTSFETVLLHCIMTAVLSVCIKKKLIRNGEFWGSHFNIEDGRRKVA